MRYRIPLSPAVKSIAEWQLEHFKEDKRQLEQMKNDLVTIPIANSEHRRSTATTRPTEAATVRILSAPYIRRMETGVAAVERALNLADPDDRTLIRLVYWEKRYNVDGAANALYMSRTTAYRRINEILGCIAYDMGYLKGIER